MMSGEMKSVLDDVILAFAVSNTYVLPLCVTIESVVETAAPGRTYRIFVLHDSLSPANIVLVENMGTRRAPVRCIRIGHLLDQEAMYPISYFSREIYYRLLIADALPDYGKVLYLDCDMIVRKDVGALFDTQLDGAVLGAVKDTPGSSRRKDIEKGLGIPLDRYFNSGVLLIDTRRFAAEKIKERSFELLYREKRLITPDQDALNVVCWKTARLLDERWNVFWERTFAGFPQPPESAWILHYISPVKPWNSVGFAQTGPFWSCAKKTPVYSRLCDGILCRPLDRVEHVAVQGAVLYQYQAGGLGFRYILRLMGAWLSFKLFGKPESGEEQK
ncbi:glycosyltransferase family 8 protein [Papillibacter cinnamivorans]|uniref:Lipopolysaccharide biosynthesis protein, LPS:glycosyltransferase n=1 Tax=Papillibacter cinnamivorans DSM 12816 TaxID=1122930 RepID=A0A1W2CGD3_9FIRM|nr:glycosyltransferase family 8 protein [Papillibacter cinnamivorans]SMC83708.1 Lipopolysaccharide biosynthesis protein, LPS:glycosyltransferase [Papillibacter cinnamivorans DSM 12816]